MRRVLGRTETIVVDDAKRTLARTGDAIADGVAASDEVFPQIKAVVDAILESADLCDQTGSVSAAR